MHEKLYFVLLFNIVLLTVNKCSSSEEDAIITSENFRKATGTPGFVFSMPKTLTCGRNETVCLSLHGTGTPCKTIVDLKWKNKHFLTNKILETENSCFDLYVPNVVIKEPQYVGIRVQVQLNKVIQSAHNQDPILLYPKETNRIFIDTDRGAYKAGDKVKLRILVLDEKLLPEKKQKISEVRIKNPHDVTVAIWDNLSPDTGLVQLEYQTVQESLTGKWKIEVMGKETKTFEIFKHLLPRFKIELNYPKVIYYAIPSMKIEVCAKYSFGKQVNGNALIKISDSHHNMEPIIRNKELLQTGCANFTLSNSQLSLENFKIKYPMYDPKAHIHVTATVTERGTNKIHMTMGKTLISMSAFSMKFISEPVFQPGLPYKGQLLLHNFQVDLHNEVVEICYNIAIKKSWNYLNNEQCENFTVSSGGEETINLAFALHPMKGNVIHINLKARSLNHTDIGDGILVVRLYSPSNSYLMLERTETENSHDCNLHHQLAVLYTTDKLEENQNVTFHYMIKTQNHLHKLRKVVHTVRKSQLDYMNNLRNIVGQKNKYVKTGVGVDNFVLSFKIDKRVGPKYQILVYYVTDDGETVATSKTIDVKPCLLKVEAKWSPNQAYPAGFATLHIKTSSSSLCSITAVDKSTKFLSNPHQMLNENILLKTFTEEREGAQSGRKTCVQPTKRTPEALMEQTTSAMWDLKKRKKRYIHSFSEDFDVYDTFNKFGTIIITNLKIVTKPCYNGPLLSDPINQTVQFLTGQYQDDPEDKTIPIRYFFPKTWLWELVPVKNLTKVSRQLPHTVTNWVTNVLCVSETEGVGFSKETEVSGFQPFFVDILTPYSVKRGENFYLYVTVFNYMKYNFPVRITLAISPGLELTNPQDKLSTSLCIQANSTVTHAFPLHGTEIATVNVTVLAEVDYQFPGFCGPETVVSRRDVVFKNVVVEPEGYPVKITKSVLLCAADNVAGAVDGSSSNVTWNLVVPPGIVEGTAKAYISLNGDLLGKTLENLEDLLSIPSGCGEQIMASVAPNLYVLKYLNATKNLTPSVRQRIIRNIKMGYQRILNYVHKDGSFSAFGYHDPTGSMFLTVFVVRTLSEAKQHIYVDQRILEKAVAWIFDHQLENGCFSTMHHVFQEMGGTSNENSTAGLTSYVVGSLMEAKISVPKSVQTNAKYCIRSQHNPDKYTLALSCYALFKVTWYSEANRLLKRLISMANQQQNLMWWSNKGNSEAPSTASDIEITSYALLALLHQNTSENLAMAHSVARWLSSKHGPNGGFRSTQDTVVTLDALAKYATFINSKQLDLLVRLDASDKIQEVFMKGEDRLKSKRLQLSEPDSHVQINVDGEGCVLVQSIVSYYLGQIPHSEAFMLAVEVAPVSTIDQCSVASLSPCLAYLGPDAQSNMAVLEVTLPSGYEADRASLYKLVEGTESRIKMFEEIYNRVIIYFTKLDKQEMCFSFNINENSLVDGRKESLIKLYDYYKPEYESLQFYTMNTSCLLNDSLAIPEIIPKERPEMVKREINRDFVHKDVNLDVPQGQEGNVAIYVKAPKNMLKLAPENGNRLHQLDSKLDEKIAEGKLSRAKSKRNAILNPKFVDLDVDMEVPNGIERNVPVYTLPDKNKTESTNNKL